MSAPMLNFLARTIPAVLVLSNASGALSADLRTIPVPRVTLYPGDAVLPSLLVSKTFKFPSAAGSSFATEPSQLAGKFARRRLVAGKPIAFTAIRNAELVRQGSPVLATYEDGGLVITMQLMPLQTGEAGQRIQARNTDTGRIVQAIVGGDGTLRVEGSP